jgi:DNA-binding MarR family transcriptional regulator
MKTASKRPGASSARSADTDIDSAAVRSWLSVVNAYHLCDTLMARRRLARIWLLAEIGVRTPEHEILANLRRSPGLTQQALASRCFSAKSHISGLLTLLEGRGWLRREPDPTDARAKRLYLEPMGERVAAQTAAVQAAVVAVMVNGETAATLGEVAEAMKRVSARLQAQLAD